MGARARQVFDEQSGATARCVAALRELLAGQSAAQGAKQSETQSGAEGTV
jgi:hypothetical protein